MQPELRQTGQVRQRTDQSLGGWSETVVGDRTRRKEAGQVQTLAHDPRRDVRTYQMLEDGRRGARGEPPRDDRRSR